MEGLLLGIAFAAWAVAEFCAHLAAISDREEQARSAVRYKLNLDYQASDLNPAQWVAR